MRALGGLRMPAGRLTRMFWCRVSRRRLLGHSPKTRSWYHVYVLTGCTEPTVVVPITISGTHTQQVRFGTPLRLLRILFFLDKKQTKMLVRVL